MGKRGLNCPECRRHMSMERPLSNTFTVPAVLTYWCGTCRTYYNFMEIELYSGLRIVKSAIQRYYGPKQMMDILKAMAHKDFAMHSSFLDKEDQATLKKMAKKYEPADVPKLASEMTNIEHRKLKTLIDKAQSMLLQWYKETAPRPGQKACTPKSGPPMRHVRA